jgi:glycosyltransferase involved in cell wall biosynthesis
MGAGKRFPKVLIDGIFFQIARTGIARVWTSLLRYWADGSFADSLLLLDRAETAPPIDGVRRLTIPGYDYRASGDDALRLQALCDQEEADLFVSTYYTAPLTTPTVFFAYDMIPEVYGHELDAPMWREKHYGIQHAAAHVAISQNTAHDLMTFFPEIGAASVTVAYPGVDTTFRPAAEGEVDAFRARYGVRDPYFLLVGSRAGFNGYKNALLFFRGLAGLPDRQRYAVVCVGGEAALEEPLQSQAAGVPIQVLQLSDDELRAAYGGAVALAYPSRYEGFGLPVAEAMACGCPVITCRNSSLVEVAGDAALFVPENDDRAMAEALRRVQDDEVRRTAIAAGLRQAAKFTWPRMAESVAEVFQRTAAEARRPSRLWSEFRRLQGLAQEREAMERRLRQTEKDMAELRAEFAKNHRELWEAKALLAKVEASKFWKMRTALAESKKAVLRLASRLLPRRAA